MPVEINLPYSFSEQMISVQIDAFCHVGVVSVFVRTHLHLAYASKKLITMDIGCTASKTMVIIILNPAYPLLFDNLFMSFEKLIRVFFYSNILGPAAPPPTTVAPETPDESNEGK